MAARVASLKTQKLFLPRWWGDSPLYQSKAAEAGTERGLRNVMTEAYLLSYESLPGIEVQRAAISVLPRGSNSQS